MNVRSLYHWKTLYFFPFFIAPGRLQRAFAFFWVVYLPSLKSITCQGLIGIIVQWYCSRQILQSPLLWPQNQLFCSESPDRYAWAIVSDLNTSNHGNSIQKYVPYGYHCGRFRSFGIQGTELFCRSLLHAYTSVSKFYRWHNGRRNTIYMTGLGVGWSCLLLACWRFADVWSCFLVFTVKAYVGLSRSNSPTWCTLSFTLADTDSFSKLIVCSPLPIMRLIHTGFVTVDSSHWPRERGSCGRHDCSCTLLLSGQEPNWICAVSR